jgi:hypothetical protein
MDSALLVSLGSLALASASLVVSTRQQIREREARRELADRESRLRIEEAEQARQATAAELLKRYREPLCAAAFDLQNRLGNILENQFLETYLDPGGERAEDAVLSTLFRFGQYFGWTEIVRRDLNYLQFQESSETRAISALQAELAKTFATDRHGHDFMLWVEEQRGIGEQMIAGDGAGIRCMGYATFVEEKQRFHQLFRRTDRDIREGRAHASARLRDARALLRQLVRELDKEQLLYDLDHSRSGGRIDRTTPARATRGPLH